MAKGKTINRTMYYHRFSWVDIGDEKNPNLNLQETLKKILESKTNTLLRKINMDDKESYITKSEFSKLVNEKREEKDILLLHIAFYEPTSTANTVPSPSEEITVEIDSIEPPKNQNWMDGGACILVYENDIISCPCTMGNSAAFKHLKLLIADNFNLNPSCMSFMPTANEDKIKLINKEGVSYIDLNLNLYKASLEYAKLKDRKTKDQIALGLIDALKDLFNRDDDTDIRELANMKVGLTFNLNNENKPISSKQLCELGTAFINDEKEGYSIKTQSGNTITFDDLKIKKPIKVDRNGKTMNTRSAWNCLKNYYVELEKSGIIDK